MTYPNQVAKADAFRAMHRGPNVLVLPNAWDVASIRIFEEAGVAAIATTSAGKQPWQRPPSGGCVWESCVA